MNKRLAKIDRIATEFEKVAKVLVAWGNQDLAKAILKIDPDIIKELKRLEYYNLMASILKNEKIYKNISELQFNDSTIYSALKSIQNLATTADKDYKEKIIDDLKILFEKLQKNIKIYLRSFYFGPYSHCK